MKFAFSSNAYRNYEIEECIDSIHLAGYDAIEIMCDIPHAFPPISEDKINCIKNSLKKKLYVYFQSKWIYDDCYRGFSSSLMD